MNNINRANPVILYLDFDIFACLSYITKHDPCSVSKVVDQRSKLVLFLANSALIFSDQVQEGIGPAEGRPI